MDYNDIKSRLVRTFLSLKDRFDADIDRHTNVEYWENGEGISLTFGSTDESSLLNKIMTILFNLSNLKDNLKNCLKENGYDPQFVEDEINNSIHLQVLIDIVNLEKHGSPLRKSRSLKNPILKYPSNSFRLGSKSGGGPTMFIDALIYDENGRLLFHLDELVETCYTKWVSLSKRFNLDSI